MYPTQRDGQGWEGCPGQFHSDTRADGQSVFLCGFSYADESDITVEQEAQFLKSKTESAMEIEILAEVEGIVAGLAGIDQVGSKYKVRHRADFGTLTTDGQSKCMKKPAL